MADSSLDPRARRILSEQVDIMQWPQPGAALGLLLGLFVAMLLFAVADMRRIVSGDNSLLVALNNLAVVILILMPLLTAVYAVRLPRSEIRKRNFAYTYCARCPRWVLLQGYFSSTLYRLRLLFIFLASAIPFFAAGLVQATLRRAYREGAMVFGNLGDVAGMAIFFLAFSIAVYGFTFLMIVIGTLEGLRSRSWVETILRIFLPMVFLAIPFTIALMLVGPSLITPYRFMSTSQQIQLVVTALLLLVYPYAASLYLLRPRPEGVPSGG